MSNSRLINYTKISPNKSSPRNHAIDTITIHCMAGNLTIESCGALFSKESTKASSNYGIGTDGRIGLYVEEKDRSWASSNSANDNRAITIEVANDGGAPDWHVSDKAYNSLINLLVDICERNGIKELLWKGDKNLIGQVDKQNMTVHRWFKNKACPGDYLYSLHPKIARDVNTQLKKVSKIQNEIELVEDKPTKLWNSFKSAGFTDIAIAGIMGNLYDESHFLSNNLQNFFERKFNMNDETYTAIINAGTYSREDFSRDGAGYGLAQWTYWSRKQGLYDFTIGSGFKIDDFNRQIELVIKEITSNKSLFNKLQSSKTVREASNLVLTLYERPADQGKTVQDRRGSYAQLYYDKFAQMKTGGMLVRVKRDDLRIRKGPGVQYEDTGKVTGKGVFTIVETNDNWGLLKRYQATRDGWISLDYTERM